MPAGKYRSALTALAGLSVSGVTTNYDINTAPDKIAAASLPVLIVLPNADSTYRKRFGPFEIETPSGSAALAHYVVTHVLLYALYNRGERQRLNQGWSISSIARHAAPTQARRGANPTDNT
jgi:hypothetical protein